MWRWVVMLAIMAQLEVDCLHGTVIAKGMKIFI
jgi:hypothetical protein